MDTFILDENNNAVPVDWMTWAKWIAANPTRKRVAENTVHGKWVSTVFLGLNHSFVGGTPLLFETMVFPSMDNMAEERCERYETFAEAQAGHAKIVAELRAEVA